MEIEQDISVQLLKLINKGGKDKSQINIFNIETAQVGGRTPTLEEMMFEILKSLPEPKMQSLKKFAKSVALEHTDWDQIEASKYLGIHKRTLDRIDQLTEGE